MLWLGRPGVRKLPFRVLPSAGGRKLVTSSVIPPLPTILAVLASLLPGPTGQAPGGRFSACLAGKPTLRVPLPPELREVSGFTLTPDGRLLAHNDEFARVLEIDRRTGGVQKAFRLGRTLLPGDFEAVTMVGKRLFLATSAGTLYEAREGGNGDAVPYSVTRTGAGRICEIEGMTWDPASAALLFLCKTSRAAAAPRALTVLRWSLSGGKWLVPDRVLIPMSSPFRGSELTRDPVTGHLVALSAQGNHWVEFTVDGKLVGRGNLGKHHRQPEAMAIGADGSVWIGDEGGQGAGQLSVYACGR